MISGSSLGRLWFVSALLLGWAAQASDAASCVWKVSSPSGATLYLGGSAHALRSSDYPLPAPYNRAFDASSRLIFESDPKNLEAASKGLIKSDQTYFVVAGAGHMGGSEGVVALLRAWLHRRAIVSS